MKLIRKILLVVGIIILFCVFITSCSFSTKKDKDSDITGTYYLYEEDQLDKDSYFIITSSSWTDENNDSGTYKLNGTTIIFYMPELGNEELYRGTIGNGKLEITFEGIKTTYYKEGSEPSDDEVYYTVTFKDYDGTVLYTSSVKKGSSALYQGTTPSREGYAFVGWDKSLDNIRSNMVLTAVYEEAAPDGNIYYTVTFKDYDGVELYKADVLRGTNAEYRGITLTREGYNFVGWDKDLTNILANTTFIARYQQIVIEETIYKVNFNYNGGTSNNMVLSKEIKALDSALFDFAVTKSGYCFRGWYYNNQRIFDQYGKLINDIELVNNMTFIAVYSTDVELSIYYTVYDIFGNLVHTYSKAPNELGTISSSSTYTYNTAVSLYANPSEGYEFVGWYNDGTQISTSSDFNYFMWDTDVEFEARFKYKQYNLTLKSNDYDKGILYINESYLFYDKTVTPYYTQTFILHAYSMTNDRFIGFYNGDTLITSNPTFEFSMVNRDYEITAKWGDNPNYQTSREYNLNIIYQFYTFDSYEYNLAGKYETLPSDVGVDIADRKYRENSNVDLNLSLIPGYKFLGWYDGTYDDKKISENVNYKFVMPNEDLYLIAYYTYDYLTMTAKSNNAEAGKVLIRDINLYRDTIAKNFYFKDSVTVVANTLSSYAFLGWYDENNNLVSTNSIYTFNMPGYDYVLEAKWDTFKITYNLNGGINNDLNPSSYSTTSNVIFYPPTKEGYTLVGWYYNGLLIEDFDESLARDVELEARWIITPITLTKNIADAGNVYMYGDKVVGEEIEIMATTNPGYTFIGWYDGDNELTKELSYTFTMPTENLVYAAKWTVNTNTPYKVEHYLQNIGNDNYTLYETDNLTGVTNTQTAGSVKTYEGFTSPSITQVNIDGNGNTVIKLYYTRNSYTVTLNKDIDKAGTIIGAGTYKYGKKVTIKALTNEGYTFNGWYKNDELYTDDASFDYTIGADAVAFEARYTANKYTITIDNQAEGVTISGITSGNGYEYDSQITLTATNIPSGYTIKWERSGDVVKGGDTYTFKVPADNITITTTTITTTSIYTREGNKIYFGTYPQTKVTATTENGLLSIPFDSSTWTSYRYYISTSQSDYMYYKDVDIDNNGTYDYRGVYFTQYRPYYYSSRSSIDNTYQDDNGYSTNTIYWFSYDPIAWDILIESNGKALIIANLVLDSQDYYPNESRASFSHNGGTGYANNYELSAIRKFLNDNFYNTAFNELQKAFIETTTVDNSAASTGYSSNSYACNNTNDKMFLLSSKEVTTTSTTARQAEGSDYAKCQGLQFNSSNGNSYWWLRSPSSYNSYYAYIVNSDGNISGSVVYNANIGVRPACWIIL